VDKLDSGEPTWELVFDEDGRLVQLDEEAFFIQLESSGVEDVFVFSHGWNNDANAARSLYDAMFPLIAEASGAVEGVGRVGFVGVLWPSVWFPETPAHVSEPGDSGQAHQGVAYDETSGSDALTGAEITESMLSGFARESDRKVVNELGRLIDLADESARAGTLSEDDQERLIREIHDLAKSLAPSGGLLAEEDDGETQLFVSEDPRADYQRVADTFGTSPAGEDTEGLGDWFRKAVEGSKDMVRILSYTIMKHRAGTIGAVGLGALIAKLPQRTPRVRVHLIGHSFGARLVSFALSTVGDAARSPVRSLLLIQGAFSHFAFAHAEDNPFGKPGALHEYVDRVRGPLVATYSPFDYAVCRWYPKASFLSREDTEDVAGATRWDGMGADGFQAVQPSAQLSLLAGRPTAFDFRPGTFYRVDAGWVINDVDQSAFSGAHSDIRKQPVAELAAAAAAAGVRSPSVTTDRA
jgi:hypothetical protein